MAVNNKKIVTLDNLEVYTGKVKELIPTVDSSLSETSENPVQNKVVTQSINNLENKYKTFFGNINVTGSTLAIGSESVATVSGTTLTIKQQI